MKHKFKILIASCLLALFTNKADAQIYIQGPGVIQFSQAITTNMISSTSRMDYNAAKTKINGFTPLAPLISNISQMGGEYFLGNNMVINLVCRNRTSTYDFRPFSEKRTAYRAMFTNSVGGDSSLELDYYDEIKNVNGFEALIYYSKSDNAKDFIAQDTANKYVVIGTIYCSPNDIAAAEAYVNTLLKSITFK